MQASVATLAIAGLSPYTQSHAHAEPKLEGESHDAHDDRTWRHKMNTETRDGESVIVIPAHGFHQAIAAAAKYSKRQIPGQGKATWTAKFTAGIMLAENPVVNTPPDKVHKLVLYVNADGIRGSAKRVFRRFPSILAPWSATFDIYILDPIITEQIFREMVELAGMFVGIGQFRPEKGGHNGRFKIEKLVWQDNRQLVA